MSRLLSLNSCQYNSANVFWAPAVRLRVGHWTKASQEQERGFKTALLLLRLQVKDAPADLRFADGLKGYIKVKWTMWFRKLCLAKNKKNQKKPEAKSRKHVLRTLCRHVEKQNDDIVWNFLFKEGKKSRSLETLKRGYLVKKSALCSGIMYVCLYIWSSDQRNKSTWHHFPELIMAFFLH